MDQLIPLVCSSTGIEVDTARKALGALLRFLKDQATKSDFDFDKILGQLDGSEAVMTDRDAVNAVEKAEGDNKSGGLFGIIWSLMKAFGVLAILKKFLEPFLGENATKLIDGVDDSAKLASVLGSFGIDRAQGVSMVKTVVDFLKKKLDPSTIEALVEQVPVLKLVLSEGKKEE